MYILWIFCKVNIIIPYLTGEETDPKRQSWDLNPDPSDNKAHALSRLDTWESIRKKQDSMFSKLCLSNISWVN